MSSRRDQADLRTAASVDVLLAALRASGRAHALSAERVREMIVRLLDVAGLDYDQRVDVLGGALVTEAVRPFWEAGHAPADAHRSLRRRDAELADIVEALSPVLLARVESRAEALRALAEVETLFGPRAKDEAPAAQQRFEFE